MYVFFTIAIEDNSKSVASAINLKTGSSVISLELGLKQSFGSQQSLKPSRVLSKTKANTSKKRSLTSRDKRGIRKPAAFRSVDSLSESLSSINMPLSQDQDDSDQVIL